MITRTLKSRRSAIRWLAGMGGLFLSLAPATALARAPHVVFLIGEEEYRMAETLPAFARSDLAARGIESSFVFADPHDPNRFPDLLRQKDIDLLVVSTKRRLLPAAELDVIRRHLAAGRPVVGLRIASHAFAPPLHAAATSAPAGAGWATFDWDVLGGTYALHTKGAGVRVTAEAGAARHPVLAAVPAEFTSAGTLYHFTQLGPGTQVLLRGQVDEGGTAVSEPVAWTNRVGASRVFYTSLGHPDDFRNPAFRRLLENAMLWALDGRPRPAVQGHHPR